MVWNYQNADCSLRKKFHCVIYYNFRQTFVPYVLCCKWTTSEVAEYAINDTVADPENRKPDVLSARQTAVQLMKDKVAFEEKLYTGIYE